MGLILLWNGLTSKSSPFIVIFIETSITHFKANCLEYIKTVERQGGVVIITRHGKPAAKLVPMEDKGNSPVFGCGAGSVREVGPTFSTGERWDAD